MDDPAKSDTLKRFPWPEQDLPALLGLASAEFPKFRELHLVAGMDFSKKNRAVRWSYDAVVRVATANGVQPDDLRALVPPPAGSEPPGPPARQVVTFAVYNRRTVNPHILLVTDGKGLFRVRVKEKENFRTGMKVTCSLIPGESDLYALEGNCPRYPGRY